MDATPILTEIGTPTNIRPKKIRNNINVACITPMTYLPPFAVLDSAYNDR